MLAKEVILSRLRRAQAKNLAQQLINRQNGVVDASLECNIALGYALDYIYPWLTDKELDQWRDQVEEVCDCILPCSTCDGQVNGPEDYDPTTMKWVEGGWECEEKDGTWIPDEPTNEWEDDGITTTLSPPPTTTQFPNITTTTITDTGECWGPFGMLYKENATGPNSIEMRYLNCQGQETTIVFTKGVLMCVRYRFRNENHDVFITTDPNNQQYLTVANFSAGIIPCGDIPVHS